MGVPALLVVSGKEGFLRRRFLAEFLEERRSDGVSIEIIDGEPPRSVEQALDGGMFFSQRMAVVENPEKGNLDTYKAHAEVKDPQTILLLHVEGQPDGRTKFGKWVKSLSKKVHQNFPLPDKFKEEEAAITFLEEEVRRCGKSFGHPELSRALVSRCGYDFGFLALEVKKMVAIVDHHGTNIITSEILKGVLGSLTQSHVGPVIDALTKRDKAKLMKALSLIPTKPRDPSMLISGALQKTVLRWFQVLNLDALPTQEMARILKANHWFIKNKVLPVAKHWGMRDILRLIEVLANAERSVLSGHINPWRGFCANLILAC